MLAVLVAAFACEKKNDNNGDPVAVTDVSLNQTSATLTTGGTLTLVATVEPDDATVKTVEWESSNPTVATVLSSGLVTAIAPGSATIMVVTDDGNKTATCALTVNARIVSVTSVSLTQTSATLTTGGTMTLSATVEPDDATNPAVTWMSSSTITATVDNAGKVTALAPGATTITVTTADGGYTASCALTVTPIAVTSVSLNQTAAILIPGGTMTLTATVLPANAANQAVTWTSSSTVTATVDNAGKVTAVALGSATITVTTADGGYTDTCQLTVAEWIVDGVLWATKNVADYQTFAERPDMYTKFYQWNRSTAWPATGEVVTGWSEEDITDPIWTINPCPAGWRLPTDAEWSALETTGSTWANAGMRGNVVAGRFFGPRHSACTLPSDMLNCIFLPAVGWRHPNDGGLLDQSFEGYYWSSTQNGNTFGYNWRFYNTISTLSYNAKALGFSVRCVK